ncbi:glutamate ABC transporter ATP-binding protein [Gallibacterium anatis]|uniref:amino acid ABC transporter ATP-binding protein n=1 Tax=Gallibacterium anatis TaxID=750 RepID=UPI000531D1B9|nr:ATP-binding cassette domain-containing protein [Gallibacterium anatis]KGQ38351.1 glutamate ABC transporter ATP-binding protein [Gallibacterium anatis]
MSKATFAVEIKSISKSFDGIEVLRDITINVEKGKTISILGPSGSGKSTLLRCINWLEQPDRGKILIAGQRIGVTDKGLAQPIGELAKIRAKTAMVFQSFNLWPHLTILGNVIEAPVHVLGVMKDLAKEGYTMIVVTHEMEFARQVSHEVVFMDKGLVMERAEPKIFFTQPKSPRLIEFLGRYLG